MRIYTDEDLVKYKDGQLEIQTSWNRRDFVRAVENYTKSSTEKILAVSGLRGTGKTVGILQGAGNDDVAYILAQEGENESGKDYIDFLKDTKKKIILIDEYSWIRDRDGLDKYLLTAVQNGKRIVITATESITLDFLNYGKLMHRVNPVHTTMFTYDEYLRLYNKERSKESCKAFLTQGGVFEAYILDKFDTAKEYIDSAIVSNLAGYLKNEVGKEEAKTLTYAVLYKAICPSNLSSIPELRSNHVTLENYLDQMGINTDIIPEEKDVRRVADIFEHAGIIVRIPNFVKESELKEQYYITNPSLTCQLIKAVYGLDDIDNSILGHVFESSVAVQLSTNKLSDHKIYFYNDGTKKGVTDNKELDLIITDEEQEHAYFFECKFSQKDSLKSNATLLSGYLEENEFKGIDVDGRYVVYNGAPSVKDYGVGTVAFIPIGNTLDNYFEFEHNVKTIRGDNPENNNIKPDGPSQDDYVDSATEKAINSIGEKAKNIVRSVFSIIIREKERVKQSFDRAVTYVSRHLGLGR